MPQEPSEFGRQRTIHSFTVSLQSPFSNNNNMRFHYSASALALIVPFVLAQECPPGYERPKISWSNCPVNKTQMLQCATLEVPLDYADPTGDVLNIRLVRIPASSPNPRNRSIIYNPGGPGDAGIASLIDDGSGLDTQK